jgi:hypothetical protein
MYREIHRLSISRQKKLMIHLCANTAFLLPVFIMSVVELSGMWFLFQIAWIPYAIIYFPFLLYMMFYLNFVNIALFTVILSVEIICSILKKEINKRYLTAYIILFVFNTFFNIWCRYNYFTITV